MAANGVYLSPGVYTREIDLSFLPQQIPAVGAAVIGPTVRGPAFRPTAVSTYQEYVRWFGDTFTSGSGATERLYKYLTSYVAEEYLRYGEILTVVRVMNAGYQPAYSYVINSSSFQLVQAGTSSYGASNMAFKIVALTDGAIANSGQSGAADSGSSFSYSADESTSNSLVSGSAYNMRWEVANVDPSRGIFDLYVRRGDDISNRKIVLEQYIGLSLDPDTNNYITKVIGDQTQTLRYDSDGSPYLELSGSFPNRSRFIRIEGVNNTLRYLNSAGTIRSAALSASLPAAVSGTFGYGNDGNVVHPRAMYENIFATNTQGFNPASASWGQTAYQDAIDILSNKDQFDLNLLLIPGIMDGLNGHGAIATRAVNMCEDRGDMFYVCDPTSKGSTVGQAQNASDARNTNYMAYYYPWCQISDADLGRNVWVPPSCVVAGAYAFNDKVAHPWFAPAGLNRGGLERVIQTERLLTPNDRDNLYRKNINPIASFPRQGVTVWGQKTLQKKQSALDRINVRRLLIDAKRFVAYIVKYLVFENNTVETRARFIELVEPYFRNTQAAQGLYDYRIIIDERNNTPDVIDRNEMKAAIYLKPAKTAEFINVDFIILPTGAVFPIDNQ